jgi:hypothetical protein
MIVFLIIVRENYLYLKIYYITMIINFERHVLYLEIIHCCEVSTVWSGKIPF